MKKSYMYTFIFLICFMITFTIPAWAVTAADIPENKDSSMDIPMKVLEFINKNRTSHGLPNLTLDPQILPVSNLRAQEISHSFSHTRPDGRRYSTAFSDLQVSYQYCGEILAYGFQTPEQVVNAWMSSPGHYDIITSAHYTHVGISHIIGNNDLNYWAVEFLSN